MGTGVGVATSWTPARGPDGGEVCWFWVEGGEGFGLLRGGGRARGLAEGADGGGAAGGGWLVRQPCPLAAAAAWSLVTMGRSRDSDRGGGGDNCHARGEIENRG